MSRYGYWLLVATLLAGCSRDHPVSAPPDPQQVVIQALAHPGDKGAGELIFKSRCIHCHGDQSAGEPPTDFDLGEGNPRRFRGYQELSREDHVNAVVNGFVNEDTGHQNMPAFALRLTPQQVADVVAYERSIMAKTGPYWEESRRSWWPRRATPQKPPGY